VPKPKAAKVAKKVKKPKTVNACKLTEGVVSTYGDLLKTRGDGSMDRDHIPSYKSGETRATFLAGRKLTPAEKGRVKRRMKAIVLKKAVHKSGRTYGGKNTPAQTSSDAQDLQQAALDDINAYKAQGVDATTISTMQGMVMTNPQYDKMLMNAVNDT